MQKIILNCSKTAAQNNRLQASIQRREEDALFHQRGQTTNESKLQSNSMYTNRHQMLRVFSLLQREINLFALRCAVAHKQDVERDQSSPCAYSSDISLIQLWLEKVGMMLITMGGEALLIPPLRFFDSCYNS